AGQMAVDLARVVSEDLVGSGLFREVPASAYISTVSDFNAPIQYADW
ncbi:MAG TPA: Tol-Pal system protein TolB, partial [Sulfitobacter sp.]|nr:Tol-Pal system protein TolB [Sulfitobacter sp.]